MLLYFHDELFSTEKLNDAFQKDIIIVRISIPSTRDIINIL